ncbi:hypothetical protein UR09_04090 [Candidatus Nitromaritima sp. SCGC AAA799-A02]|nr:hypothetical protein UR09_04090 [Candidatus Nitromaritima sp. SCGC AAA799-A02]KMP12438.1 hypothetical protein UZ36_00820 [Candidatus Nitromaritima sp. SCGC AAA799-C22]
MFPLEWEDLFGAKIKCAEERWDHISSRHPEVGALDNFSQVLNDPDVIIRSRIEPDTKLFHRKYEDQYLVLVVNKGKNFIIKRICRTE